MKLTVLGSGAAMYNPAVAYRYPAAHLVETAHGRILLDAGTGTLPRIAELGLQLGQVDTIAISHFHADHCTLGPLLQGYFLEGKFRDNKPKLHVLGPKGIAERIRTAFDQAGFSYLNDLLPNVDLLITEYEDRRSVDLGDNRILTPYQTQHYGLDAYSFRLEADGKVLTYSGDSAVSDGLTAAAKSADLFLCEAATHVGKPSDSGHVGTLDAGKTATTAQAKHLVITHYSGYDSNEDMLAEIAQSNFAGQVSIADDLSTYEI